MDSRFRSIAGPAPSMRCVIGKVVAHAPWLSEVLDLGAFMPWEVEVNSMHADVHSWFVSQSANDAFAGGSGCRERQASSRFHPHLDRRGAIQTRSLK